MEETPQLMMPQSLLSKMGASCTHQTIKLSCLFLIICVAILLFVTMHAKTCSKTYTCGQSQLNPSGNIRSLQDVTPPAIPTMKTWDYNWDKRDPNSQPKSSGLHANITATRTIILVRHGQYGPTGELTPLGRKQANMTGMRLAEMNWPYDRIVHSTMIRAAQTAMIVSKHLKNIPMTHDDFIREGGPVPPDPTISYWGLPDLDYFVDGPRIEAAFRKYFHRAEPSQKERSIEILVGHGNIFRYFILRALQFPRASWMRLFIPHASITIISMAPDSTVSTGHIGEAGYMPVNMNTY